jgi:hypothetical protein
MTNVCDFERWSAFWIFACAAAPYHKHISLFRMAGDGRPGVNNERSIPYEEAYVPSLRH